MRIAEIDTNKAQALCDVPDGTYNGWFTDRVFASLYQRVKEFTIQYKQQAIQMLRRDNQLAAVMLEEKIIEKMIEEINAGEYNLIRTNLARDVYTKLIGDLDIVPQAVGTTWEQKLQILVAGVQSPPAIAPPPAIMIDRPVVEVNQ